MKKGFTLIELLVVIGIIGLLVSIAVPNFLSARQRASDSKKKSEMQQLKNALRMYYNDYNRYPDKFDGLVEGVQKYNYVKGCGADGTSNCDRVTCTNADFAAGGTGCDNVYMKRFPSNLGSGTNATYYYPYIPQGVTVPQDFCLRALLDNKSDSDILTSQSRCVSACGSNCTGGATTGRYCVCAD